MSKEIKINFLFQSIADTQDLIRFIETKIAIGASIIGIYIATVCAIADEIIKHASKFNPLFWILFSLLIISFLICIWIIVLAIKSVNNPRKNIKIANEDIPSIEFFISKNEYGTHKLLVPFFNSKSFKLSKSFNSFIENVSNSNSQDLIKAISFELLKINYIRNIKNDRFKLLIWFLIITTVFFSLFYITYYFNLNNFC